MSSVAVLGGGAGGRACAAELAAAGHRVRLWNRNAATVAELCAAGGVYTRGVLGDGFTPLPLITTSLADALRGADVAVVCLPALAHRALADDLARLGCRVPLILNPGHTLGAVHVASRFAAYGGKRPSIAELSTLTYVARADGATVNITGRAGRVRAAALGIDTTALDFARDLWPVCHTESDVLATGLANVNLVLHPPAAVLAAAWVEATAGRFAYYREATTQAVTAVMTQLDDERLTVARALGHELDALIDEMAAIGTVDAIPEAPTPAERLRIAVATGRANASITAPDSLHHRYYREDFAYGLAPLIELAAVTGVAVPIAKSLFTLADCALGGAASRDALTLAAVRLTVRNGAELIDAVTNGAL